MALSQVSKLRTIGWVDLDTDQAADYLLTKLKHRVQLATHLGRDLLPMAGRRVRSDASSVGSTRKCAEGLLSHSLRGTIVTRNESV